MSGRAIKSFAVEGAGEFPYDLLRRDQCWPATPADANSLALHPASGDPEASRTRYVRLETAADASPHRALWRARGWPVID
jgi:hypothetical protein